MLHEVIAQTADNNQCVRQATWNGMTAIMDVGTKLDVLTIDTPKNGKDDDESVCMIRWTRQPDGRVLYRLCDLSQIKLIEDTITFESADFQYIPKDHKVLPLESNPAMRGGLAKEIMVWLSFDGLKTPRRLFGHLTLLGMTIPQWLKDTSGMMNLDEVPSEGTRCAILYKAMATS